MHERIQMLQNMNLAQNVRKFAFGRIICLAKARIVNSAAHPTDAVSLYRLSKGARYNKGIIAQTQASILFIVDFIYELALRLLVTSGGLRGIKQMPNPPLPYAGSVLSTLTHSCDINPLLVTLL